MGEDNVVRSHTSGLDVDTTQKRESRAIIVWWVGVEQLSKKSWSPDCPHGQMVRQSV